MQLKEAKAKFINSWGSFGSQWGINKTMAQIHALLLVSSKPLSADEIMEELSISRGNVNMNTRDLIDWGLVERIFLPGERKEFFEAEKDIWKVSMMVAKERKKRELEPMLKLLAQLEKVEGDKKEKDTKQFIDTVHGIKTLGDQADRMIDVMVKAEANWFSNNLLKFFMK